MVQDRITICGAKENACMSRICKLAKVILLRKRQGKSKKRDSQDDLHKECKGIQTQVMCKWIASSISKHCYYAFEAKSILSRNMIFF
ncbi:hypothetical protein TIFTF001_003042 [Ficus carica]|uniref:Uncharacterized protein n=1 Tax=Ficus carica TaxID=3494 RepID=A0AA87Z698_FICCA|nr:hypothetical protein TIFTF001_003042 [Ficus carica]